MRRKYTHNVGRRGQWSGWYPQSRDRGPEATAALTKIFKACADLGGARFASGKGMTGRGCQSTHTVAGGGRRVTADTNIYREKSWQYTLFTCVSEDPPDTAGVSLRALSVG